jgi:hypothetical protein
VILIRKFELSFCRSHAAGNTNNTAYMEMKKQDDDYFSGTKQCKNKGKRKNKIETVISLKDLERPLLEAATHQKPVWSHQRSAGAHRQETYGEYCYRNSPG